MHFKWVRVPVTFGTETILRVSMNPLHIETPLFESRALSLRAGRAVWLKVEALQPPGSFKIRGIGYACQEYARGGAKRFISSSGGNAGIAVAYAGRHLSVPVVVVVPQTTTERAKDLIRQEGAEVMVHGASWREANALAMSMVTDADAFLHPFDNPLIWHGHSSLVDEVVLSGLRPEAVVLSVGGGGGAAGSAGRLDVGSSAPHEPAPERSATHFDVSTSAIRAGDASGRAG